MRFRPSVLLPAFAALLMAVVAADLLRAQTPVQTEPARKAAVGAKDEPKTDAPLTAEDQAALAVDQKLMTEAKDHSEIMKNLTYISDVIGPRLTGSQNLERANKWTAEKMKEYGLENVHLEPWTIPVGWERGTASLKIIEPDKELEHLIWGVWLDLEAEMKCRTPFIPMEEIAKSPMAEQLLAAVPQVTVPSGLPPEVMNQVIPQILKQISVVNLPGIDYELKPAIIESLRKASFFSIKGKLFARRDADLKITLNNVILSSQWIETSVPEHSK